MLGRPRISSEFVTTGVGVGVGGWGGRKPCAVDGHGEDLEDSKLSDCEIPESSLCGLKI